MKRVSLLGVLFACSLAACGGGGGGSVASPVVPVPTSTPTTYTVTLHWAPAGSEMGLASALRLGQTRVYTAGTGTVVVQSADVGFGKSGNIDNGSAAIVTAQVSPAPSPMPTATFSTTVSVVTLQPTPSPGPTSSASPSVGVVPNTPASSSSGTITVNVGGSVATNNLDVLRSYGIVVYESMTLQASAATNGEYAAYTVDGNCNLVGQSTPTGADVYLTWPNAAAPFNSTESEATLHVPGGGTALKNGYDPTNLTSAQWTNTATAFGLNTTYITNADDTLLFKAANGKIVYIGGAINVTPGNGSADSASLVGAVGCLN